MNDLSTPRRLPALLRLCLFFAALALIASIFIMMRALFLPSQYLHAYKSVEKGPGHAADLLKMPPLSFNRMLYLVGPVNAASGKKGAQLCPSEGRFVFAPSTFSDATGAVEVLAMGKPESDTSLGGYFYNEPLHLLGWRNTRSGFSLFMIAKNKDDLLKLLTRRSEFWQKNFFIQALLLFGLVFVVFWFVNMAVLCNVRISLAQVLVVNLIFLIFLYCALPTIRYWPLCPTCCWFYFWAIWCLCPQPCSSKRAVKRPRDPREAKKCASSTWINI